MNQSNETPDQVRKAPSPSPFLKERYLLFLGALCLPALSWLGAQGAEWAMSNSLPEAPPALKSAGCPAAENGAGLQVSIEPFLEPQEHRGKAERSTNVLNTERIPRNSVGSNWLEKGLKLRREGRYEEALASFSLALESEPGMNLAYLYSAIVWEFDLQDAQKAKFFYRAYSRTGTGATQKGIAAHMAKLESQVASPEPR